MALTERYVKVQSTRWDTATTYVVNDQCSGSDNKNYYCIKNQSDAEGADPPAAGYDEWWTVSDGTTEVRAWTWAEMIAASQPAAGYRVNIKTGTYDLSAGAVTLAQVGPWVLQGYTTTIGDGGKATLDNGTATTDMLTVSASTAVLADLIFNSSTDATGTGDGVRLTGAGASCIRCVASGWRNNGFETATLDSHILYECEAYDCNRAGTALKGGFVSTVATTLVRCVSHHNDQGSDADCHGFYHGNNATTYIECVAHSNSGHGFFAAHRTQLQLYYHCDAYANAGDGFHIDNSGYYPSIMADACNAISNTGDGWELTQDVALGLLSYCGAYNNANRTTGSGEFLDTNAVTYTAVPYDDGPNGNFTLDKTNGASGRGGASHAFTTSGYSSTTTGYRDVGASHHTPPAAADVRYGVEVRDTTGLLEIPNEASPTGTQDATSDALVKSGALYGSPQRTGTLAAGGGGLLRGNKQAYKQ